MPDGLAGGVVGCVTGTTEIFNFAELLLSPAIAVSPMGTIPDPI